MLDLLSIEEEILTEKKKLYEALDYSENAKAASYPIEVRKSSR
jgi:hypothetical protein